MLQQTVLRLNGLPDSGPPDHQQPAPQNLMRLNAEQQIAIRELTTDLIGPDAHIWLFGSRADDQRRGGDIDLLVEVDRPLDDRVLWQRAWQPGWSADSRDCQSMSCSRTP